LKKLLEQVPLQVNIPEMLTHWKWFGEWSIGCVGILSDWVVETAATLCRAGESVLTLEALTKHALKPAQRLRLETEARTGEFKIAEAKAKSEEDLQQLLGRPSMVPSNQAGRSTFSDISPTTPSARSSTRIERPAHRDPVGEQVVTGNTAKCSYLAIIEVSSHQFQESRVLCVECPACGARRSFKVPKERPRFPSHPRRQSPPPKGEQRWVLQGQAWMMVND
jgi:hypothetical protein